MQPSVTLVVISLATAVSGNYPNIRIISGHNAVARQFTYMAQLQKLGQHFCGGSILNEWRILTAGHCLLDQDPNEFTAVVGSIFFSGYSGDTYEVHSYIIHPDFYVFPRAKEKSAHNDIAIVRLTSPIRFQVGRIQPIVLYRGTVGPNRNVVATGWGNKLYENATLNTSPDRMQWIRLKTISNDQCLWLLKPTESYDITDSMLCTLNTVNEGMCHGDSGSPLMLNGKQVGIVSTGESCALGYPDVFTRVQPFLSWIHLNSRTY